MKFRTSRITVFVGVVALLAFVGCNPNRTDRYKDNAPSVTGSEGEQTQGQQPPQQQPGTAASPSPQAGVGQESESRMGSSGSESAETGTSGTTDSGSTGSSS